MPSPHQRRLVRAQSTREQRLLAVLRDRRWHSTRELVRRVGHTFASAKHWLMKRGATILRQRDKRRRHGYRYRLESPLRMPLRLRNE